VDGSWTDGGCCGDPPAWNAPQLSARRVRGHVGAESRAGRTKQNAPVYATPRAAVERLEPDDEFRTPLQAVGFIHRVGGVERTKRYFREPPGGRRTHIHVRGAGSFSEQFALLFRDYLRSDRSAAHEYEAVKRELAERLRDDRHAYVDAKTQMVWELMRRADEWAGRVGWAPGPSDA
jgi:GrpB-like predicted nucleotidyltransferase (UPF0157 family)